MSAVNYYEIDDMVLVQSSPPFANAAGTPTDPSVVTLYYTDPTGAETTVPQSSLTRISAGVWSYQLAVSISGAWVYKFQGTGAVTATSPDTTFIVNPSLLING